MTGNGQFTNAAGAVADPLDTIAALAQQVSQSTTATAEQLVDLATADARLGHRGPRYLDVAIHDASYTPQMRALIAQITGTTPTSPAHARATLRRWTRHTTPTPAEPDHDDTLATLTPLDSTRALVAQARFIGQGTPRGTIDPHTNPTTATPCPLSNEPFVMDWGPTCPACNRPLTIDNGQNPAIHVPRTMDHTHGLTSHPLDQPMTNAALGLRIDAVTRDRWGNTTATVHLNSHTEPLRLGPTHTDAEGLARALDANDAQGHAAQLLGRPTPHNHERTQWLITAWLRLASPLAVTDAYRAWHDDADRENRRRQRATTRH